MSYINPPIQLYEIIFELQVAGYQPVLAHPERYKFYHHSFKDYETAQFGLPFPAQPIVLRVIMAVMWLLSKTPQKGLIDFAGSDVHHQNHIAGFSKRLLFHPQQQLKEAITNNQFFRF
jgi:tyrosine-protein phosphatase YwqE